MDPARLRQVGKLVSFRIEGAGYKGKRLPIPWTTLLLGGEPVAESARPGAYQVELTLLDDDDEPLDAARTGIFRVRA